MDVRQHNRSAWNALVRQGNLWTRPVSSEAINAARQGDYEIFLTPTKPIPRAWFPELVGCDVLCLASGGGQQGPLLAAAGASVTVLDFSPEQLSQDRLVAERDGLALRTVQGDMADLSMFADHSFDLVVHPVSNVYIPAIQPVWAEAYRVLRTGGCLLSGFMNPMYFIFDQERMAQGTFEVKYPLPYSELTSISAEERQQLIDDGDVLQFSHTLDEQIGGQIAAGFVISGFYEDRRHGNPLAPYIPTHVATHARKI